MIFIDAVSTGYTPNQVGDTLTVGELMDVLEGYNTDEKIYLRFDRGYTFGKLTYDKILDDLDDEEEE